MKLNGIITKLVGGTYSVCASEAVYECKARGVFRKRGLSPVCGDRVEIDTDENVITEVYERRSFIVRPPLANIDVLVLVSSTKKPDVNFTLLDKFSAVAVFKGIEPCFVFTKTDLSSADEHAELYRKAGFKSFCVNNLTGEGAGEVKNYLKGKISAFTGNTGVGKSSLLNNIFPDLSLNTSEISEKLGRGRHTTRHTELFPVEGGGYIADTPGFSTFETNRYDIITQDKLDGCFPEFSDFLGKCKFLDCKHLKEPQCAVKQAVEDGLIAESRYQSYCEMQRSAGLLKEWEINEQKK